MRVVTHANAVRAALEIVIAVLVTLGFIVLALAGVPRLAFADWPQSGRALVTAAGDQIGPAIAPDGAGGAIVAWHDRRTFPFNIDARHVLATGALDPAWPINGRALMTDALIATIVPQGKEFPAIVSDGAGGAIVTWPDARSSGNGLDIHAQHVLASGAVDASWPVNSVTVCSATGDQIAPVIVSDGNRGAFIAWSDARTDPTSFDFDVFAQHVLASGVVDPAWPANGTLVSAAPKGQVGLAIVADGLGGIIVTWTDFRSGNPGSDIYAGHVFGTGVVDPAWPVNGLALCDAAGSQTAPRIVSDAAQGAIVAWTDTREGANQIFAQRVSSAGVIVSGWPINGRKVSIDGVDEVLPTLAADGAHGAIVAWGGGNTGHHNQRAHHLLASGLLDASWPATGVALSFDGSEQINQVMASDGSGGAIVAWQQGGFDIFAQHVLASGALDSAYPANGRAVVLLTHEESEPDIVATGAGGAIVTWMDTRDGNTDIYALQVLAAGNTVGIPPSTAPDVNFFPPRPNPARGSMTLRYALPRQASVRLAIFDVTGRRVRDLTVGPKPQGEHAIDWDLRDQQGQPVGVGIYFARLEVERHTLIQRIGRLR